MAIRYVKDFEFPAAAGYTKSATKVTGQMLAKGGPAKAPKGIMVMIGVGKPVKKAEGDSAKNYDDDGYDRQKLAQMSGDANAVTEAENIMRGQGAAITASERRAMNAAMAKKKVQARKPQGSPYIPGSNIPQTMVRTPEEQAAAEAGSGPVSGGDNRSQGSWSQAYAKGGKAKMAAKVGKVMHEFKAGELHSGSKKGPKVSNPKQAIAIALSEAGKAKKMSEGGDVKKYVNLGGKRVEDTPEGKLAHVKKTFPNVTQVTPEGNPIFDKKAKGGYAEGGEPKPIGYHVIDTQTGDVIGKFKNASAATHMVDRKDNQHGGYRYQRKAIWPGEDLVPKAKGGKVSHMEWEHSKEDLAQDRKLAKKHGMSLEAWEKSSMDAKHDKQQSTAGLKKGGMAQKVQMAKSNAIEASLKGQKKTPYAEGGVAARPLSLAVRPGARQSAPDIAKMGATMGKAMGGPAMPPLQRGAQMPMLKRPTPARPGAVPVAPAGPMIAPPQGGVGVNAKRPGGPNVGAIRAAMARAATAARPEASPAMMKKGGKTKC
jgi:hypothetical protein